MTVNTGSTSSFFVTVNPTSTIPTSPGFTPISLAYGFYGKRDEHKPRASFSLPSLAHYPTTVSCAGVIEFISTSTYTVSGKTTETSLTPTPIPTKTSIIIQTLTSIILARGGRLSTLFWRGFLNHRYGLVAYAWILMITPNARSQRHIDAA